MTTRTALFLLPLAGLLACAESDIDGENRDGMVEQQDPGTEPGDSSSDPADDGDPGNPEDSDTEENYELCEGRSLTVTINDDPANYGGEVFVVSFRTSNYEVGSDGTVTFEFTEDHDTTFMVSLDEPNGMTHMWPDEVLEVAQATNDGNDVLSLVVANEIEVDIADCAR